MTCVHAGLRATGFFVALACAAACVRERRGPDDPPPPRRPTTPAIDAPDMRLYVPTTPGDRWRVVHEPGHAFDHYGVSAIDARGNAIVHGTDHTTIELVEAHEDGVYLVSPEGVRVVPVVVRPITRGASTAYSVAQGTGTGRCTLVVTTTGESASVAGRVFDGCFSQRRTCAMPSGGGLPVATTITEDETYCPHVGRVKHHFVAEPPLPFEGVSSDRRTELVSFHVRGAPVLPDATSLADRLIVLPTDLSAACGGAVVWADLRVSATAAPPAANAPPFVVPSDARAGDTLLAFGLTDGPFVMEARSAAGELAAYVGEAGESAEPTRRGFVEGTTFVRLTPSPACRARASALEPLLRSLLR